MVERLRAFRYDLGQGESHGIKVVQRDADALFDDIADKYHVNNIDPELRDWGNVIAIASRPVTTKRFLSCATKKVKDGSGLVFQKASSAASSAASAVKDAHTSIVGKTRIKDGESSDEESIPELDVDDNEKIPFVVGGDFSLGEVRLIYDKDSHRPLVRHYVDGSGSRRSRANAAMPVVGRPLTGLWLMNDTVHCDAAKRSATVIRTSWMESITVRSEAKYEGRHTGHLHPKAYVRNGETFTFIGEPKVVEWHEEQTGEVYDIKFYKLADKPGWVHDFHHDYPLTKTILLNPWQQEADDQWHYASAMQDEALAHKILTLNAPTLVSQHSPATDKKADLDEFDDDEGDDSGGGSDGGERAISLGSDDNNGGSTLDAGAVVAMESAPGSEVVLDSARVKGLEKKKEEATCCSFKPKKEHDRMLDVDGIEHIESRVDRFGMSVCQVLQVHWIKVMSTSIRGFTSVAHGEWTQDEMKHGEEATTADEEAMARTSYEVVAFVAIPKRDPDTKTGYIEVVEVHLDQVWVIPAYPCGWVLSTDGEMWHDLQRQAEKLRRTWKPTEHWSYLDRRADSKLRKKMAKSFYVSAHVRHVEVGSNVCPLKQKRRWPFNQAGGGDMSFHPLGVPTDMSFINDLHASFFQHRTDPVTGIKYGNQAVQQQKTDNMGEVRLIMLLQDDETDNGTTELWLRIVEARGLMPADSNGGSDPYVEVYLCDDEGDPLPNVKKHRSSVRDNTLRPYWNTKMILGRNQLFNVETVGIRIDMFDHDQGGFFGWDRDDCIGSTYFPMWEMRLSTIRASDIWAPLHANLGTNYSLLHELRLDAKLQQFWDNKKYELMSSVQEKLDVVGKRWAWDVVGDPWMPAPVKYLLGKLILGIFHEVRELVEGILKKQIGIKSVANHQKPSSNVVSKVDSTTTEMCGSISTVAWIRYHLDPYDKDIWQRFNDPYFVGLLILGVIPSYGLQDFVFLFKICVIDRTDDFQLLTYITTFKGLQFLTGLWSTAQGVFQYMSCTSSDTHTCDRYGPGMGTQICTIGTGSNGLEDRTCAIGTLLGFLLKVGLCYYAFYCMKFSTSTVGKLRIDERLVGALISFPKDQNGETYGRRASHVEGDKAHVQLRESQARVQRFNASTCEHQIVFLQDPKKDPCCGESRDRIPVDALARSPEFEALKKEFIAARKEAESIEAKDMRTLVDQNHGGEQCPFLRTLQAVGQICELLPDGKWRTNAGANLDLLWGEIKELVNSGKLKEGIADVSPLRSVEEYKIMRYMSIAEECLEIDFPEGEEGWSVKIQIVMKLRKWASRYIDLARHTLSATNQDILDLDLRKVHFKVVCPPGMKRSPVNSMWNWDICVLLVIAIGFTLFGVLHRYSLTSWNLQSLMYWARTLYMLLSVPFVALKIPGLNLVITHAQRTGYNKFGATVRFAKTKLPFDACEDILNPWTPEEDAFLRNEVERLVDMLSKSIPQNRIRWGNHHDRHPADLIDWEALASSNHHKDRSAHDLKNRARLLFEGDLDFKKDVERTSPTQRPWTRDDDERCREAVAFFKLNKWSALTNASMPVLTPHEKSDLLKVQREYNQAEEEYHKNELSRETKRVLTEKKKELRGHKEWYKARKEFCKWELVADYVNGDIILHKGRWCGPLYETKDLHVTTRRQSLAESPRKVKKTETRNPVDEDDEEALLDPVLDDNRLDAAACRHRWCTVLEPGQFKVLKARADVRDANRKPKRPLSGGSHH